MSVPNLPTTVTTASDATVCPVPGVRLPERTTTTATTAAGVTVAITSRWAETTGSYETTAVTVSSANGRPVTGAVLRSVPLAGIAASGAADVVDQHWPPPSPVEVTAGPTPEVLTAVAAWFRRATAAGRSPQPEIARELGVPRGTAARWITRVRDRGLLDFECAT